MGQGLSSLSEARASIVLAQSHVPLNQGFPKAATSQANSGQMPSGLTSAGLEDLTFRE